MDLNTLKHAVYKINTATGSGTGFFLKQHNIIVTNYHVIEGNKQVSIENQKQDRWLANVVYVNPDNDIAFLKSDAHNPITAIPFDAIQTIDSRNKVYVLGFPFGMPFTITEGIVSNERQILDGKSFIQTDAAVNPGNSGGPMLNIDGNLIGITTSKITNADNVGFAIPANILIEELNTFSENINGKFSLKCASCNTLIFEKTDYCPNCGANIEERIFDEKSISKLSVFVEDAIQQIGINPVLARNGNEYWEFHSGSALVRIFVYENKYLYATSPMNILPTENIEKILEYILSNPVKPYQLAIYKNQIFLSYRIHLSDIITKNNQKVKSDLSNLILKANEMDDYFVQTFACEKTNYAKNIQ